MSQKGGSWKKGKENMSGYRFSINQQTLSLILRAVVLLADLFMIKFAIEMKVTEPMIYYIFLGVASYAALSSSKFGQPLGK